MLAGMRVRHSWMENNRQVSAAASTMSAMANAKRLGDTSFFFGGGGDRQT